MRIIYELNSFLLLITMHATNIRKSMITKGYLIVKTIGIRANLVAALAASCLLMKSAAGGEYL
jgi:hypothetical protein